MKKKISAIIFAMSLFVMAFSMNYSDSETPENVQIKNILVEAAWMNCEGSNNLKIVLTAYQSSSREMAEAIKYINNPKLARIVKRQQKENEKLLNELIASADKDFVPYLADEIANIMNRIERYEGSGNADYDYAELMIMHSRLGIKISEATKSKSGEKLKTNREQTISALRGWMKAESGAWKKARIAQSPCGGPDF